MQHWHECKDGLSDTERVRNYQRENTELQIKVASLISELEEVRSAKESLSVEYEQQERLHNRNILEEIANGKQLQADNNSLRAKVMRGREGSLWCLFVQPIFCPSICDRLALWSMRLSNWFIKPKRSVKRIQFWKRRFICKDQNLKKSPTSQSK